MTGIENKVLSNSYEGWQKQKKFHFGSFILTMVMFDSHLKYIVSVMHKS